MSESISGRWKWGVFAAMAMTLLSLYPQINLWLARGREWNGAYVIVHGDEVAYSAYIQALIDGRPRRNNPYTGRDDLPGAPQPESLFSIQFIPAYAIALPARLFGKSAATAFIALLFISAFGATLAIFWLLLILIGDARFAAAAALAVLCFGTLAAGQGQTFEFFHRSFTADSFLFLRRYEPAAPFPLFFVLCVFVWHMLSSARLKNALVWANSAGALIGILIFSYFYIWTAASAWIACIAGLWLLSHREEWKRLAAMFGTIGAWTIIALIPYFLMLRHRATNLDSGQLLDLSHAPSLFRIPELIGFGIALALVLGAGVKIISLRDRSVIFVASLALLPVITFNQQVITGFSLQPFHYQWFVTNYLVLLALLATVAIFWQAGGAAASRRVPGRAIALLALVAFGMGVTEMSGATRRTAEYSRSCDEAMRVGMWLKEAAKHDGTEGESVREGRSPRPVVFSSNVPVAGVLPTLAPQAILFAWHLPSFPANSSAESRELFFRYLYYSGANARELGQTFLAARPEILAAFFGVDRVLPDMAVNAKPIMLAEAQAEVVRYAAYAASFSQADAQKPTLSYVVVPTATPPNFANIDRWYERDAGEKVGIFTIYRVKLRAPKS